MQHSDSTQRLYAGGVGAVLAGVSGRFSGARARVPSERHSTAAVARRLCRAGLASRLRLFLGVSGRFGLRGLAARGGPARVERALRPPAKGRAARSGRNPRSPPPKGSPNPQT